MVGATHRHQDRDRVVARQHLPGRGRAGRAQGGTGVLPVNLEVIEVRHGDRSYGHAVPYRITRHAHPKARPETPEPAPAPATGIAYLQLITDAHHQQVAADDRIGFDALYSRTEHNPEQSPQQPSLADLTDDQQPRQVSR